MDIREALLQEHSKAQCNRIVQWIGKDHTRFDTLLEVFLEKDYRLTQRAAWPLGCCVMEHPALATHHLPRLLEVARNSTSHPAIRRNVVRILQVVSIPEALQGIVMDLCFSFLTDPKEKAAVKAFSLTVLDHLARVYPDIRSEMEWVIRENWHREKPSFRSRARKIIGKQASPL